MPPLEIDVGAEVRTIQNPGYRQRTTLFRFLWKEYSVMDNIAWLTSSGERENVSRPVDVHVVPAKRHLQSLLKITIGFWNPMTLQRDINGDEGFSLLRQWVLNVLFGHTYSGTSL